jgi:uncharacterized protein (TIGR04206 family)
VASDPQPTRLSETNLSGEASSGGTTTTRVVAAVLLAGLLPWSVQTFAGGEVFLRFAWGGVSFEPAFTVQLLWSYPVFAGPPILLQWATASSCWLLALASAVAGRVRREDPRLTAGLLVLAGVANGLVAVEFGVQPTRTGSPTGTAAVFLVAGWRYWRALDSRCDD